MQLPFFGTRKDFRDSLDKAAQKLGFIPKIAFRQRSLTKICYNRMCIRETSPYKKRLINTYLFILLYTNLFFLIAMYFLFYAVEDLAIRRNRLPIKLNCPFRVIGLGLANEEKEVYADLSADDAVFDAEIEFECFENEELDKSTEILLDTSTMKQNVPKNTLPSVSLYARTITHNHTYLYNIHLFVNTYIYIYIYMYIRIYIYICMYAYV